MSIEIINNTHNSYGATANHAVNNQNNNSNVQGANQNQNQNENTIVPKDVVTISPEAIAKMKQEVENNYNYLKQLVESLITKQGIKISDILSGNAILYADAETIKKAQADIAEDGYWGVEQTAGRIIDFAKSLMGNDLSKLPMIRDAVEQGFAAAKEILGGLPEISLQTYDRIMAEFDRWEKEGTIHPISK
jgi:hypothetical protein